jgi:hypothetical protein
MSSSSSRREVEAHVFALQYQLIFDSKQESAVAAPAPPLDASSVALRRRRLVRVAASFLEPSHYEAVVEERSVNRVCGYPLCARALAAKDAPAKYRIAPRQGKVYSASSTARFCGEQCAVASAFFGKQLSAVNIHARDMTRPLAVRFIDDDVAVDAWTTRDAPLLNALFARLRHERSGHAAPATALAPGASPNAAAAAAGAAGAATAADAPVLADVVREVAPERRNAPPAPVVAGRPLAIDGYTPTGSAAKRAPAADNDDDDDDDDDIFDDDVDAEALKRFLDTGQYVETVEHAAPAPPLASVADVGDADLVAAFGKPVAAKLLATEHYSDFVRLWLLFDSWRPDASLTEAATVASREVAPIDDGFGDDPDDDLMLTDVDRSQGALRLQALQTMLREALRELERVCGAPLSDIARRSAQLTLAEAAQTSQLRDAVPALTPRALAWLALLVLEARGAAWSGARAALVSEADGEAPGAKRVDRGRHEALLARAKELVAR